MKSHLPVGKLPPAILSKLLVRAPRFDPHLLLGPGIGLDCAVIEDGDRFLVFKSDPITFASDQIGWYAVQINANDIATSGGDPRWMLMTLLLPEKETNAELVESVFNQVFHACEEIEVSLIGGHTEITHGLDRPIIIVTMIGEVERGRLVTPQGAKPGDRILITKGVPIEGTALIAREFPDRLVGHLTPEEIKGAVGFLNQPGISILRDARIATSVGEISAMHDPTEGGLLSALWELAEASHVSLRINPHRVPVLPISDRICQALGLNPLATIASGALLLTVGENQAVKVINALENAGIACSDIGEVGPAPVGVWDMTAKKAILISPPERDEIARLYENRSTN